MNVIVLSIDRLHAGYLGCYGNTWVATPRFNRLAAESFVFDQATIDHPRLDELVRSWWLGQHALERTAGKSEPPPTLPQRLAQAGLATALITDEPQVAEHPLAGHFGELLQVAQRDPPPSGRPADDVAHTGFATLMAEATEWLAQARQPFFLWLHSQGMKAAWDAPDDFRQLYAEPDEPEPPRLLAAPCRQLTGDEDPDEVWGICQAYAGQVSLVDACLGGLLEFLDGDSCGRETLLSVVGARGFPLGRNGRISAPDNALYSELAQVPWLMRLPGGFGAAVRSQALVQTCDLAPTLTNLLGIGDPPTSSVGCGLLQLIHEDVESVRDRVCLIGADGERAIRTPGWYLRLPAGDEQVAELFAKPDDRWDQNDVADRCPEVVDGLRQALDELETHVRGGALGGLPPLEESLAGELT
ncbi:MAG TPA: sulfatase-like hydrolase/transferase [Pirellulales bacterium]|nr:sulfatase-like hydrolase/transferase [Pirellulales bacterium]